MKDAKWKTEIKGGSQEMGALMVAKILIKTIQVNGVPILEKVTQIAALLIFSINLPPHIS